MAPNPPGNLPEQGRKLHRFQPHNGDLRSAIKGVITTPLFARAANPQVPRRTVKCCL
jgi:hypothetical protein